MCFHACANLHLPPARPADGNQKRVRTGGEQGFSCWTFRPLSAVKLGSDPLVSAGSAACNVPSCVCQLASASGKASRRESEKSAARGRTGIQLFLMLAPLCGRAWLRPACERRFCCMQCTFMRVPTCICLRQGQQEEIRKGCSQGENRDSAAGPSGPSLRASLAQTRL